MNNSKIFNAILYILGIGLIVALFFVLFQNILPENIFYLNLIVVCISFSLIMFNMGRIFASSTDMDDRAGGLGIRWMFTWLYLIGAIVGMVVMHLTHLSFSIQIIVQGALILMLLFGFSFSVLANRKAHQVADQHRAERSGLEQMKTATSRFEIRASTTTQPAAVNKLIDEIKENIRYMTPSPDEMAKELEREFVASMDEASRLISQSGLAPEADDIIGRLNACNVILKQRKNFRYAN